MFEAEIINLFMPYINSDSIEDVKQKLTILLSDYDIQKKTTELIPAGQNEAIEAVKMFFLAKKTEGCSDKTIAYYKTILKGFFVKNGIPLKEISINTVRLYIATRGQKDNLSKTSQDNELRVLKSFFGWCEENGYVLKNPTRGIKAVKKEKRIKKPFSEVEFETLRQKVGNLRDRAIIDTLYSTGCRVSELVGIDKDDISEDEVTVLGKGGKERIVYLNTRARMSIDQYLKERTDMNDALFVSLRSPYKRLTASGIENMIRDLGRECGIKKCHPHRFRRTMATNALNRGMPLSEVQKLLGHSDIETTTIYAQSEQGNVKANHGRYII